MSWTCFLEAFVPFISALDGGNKGNGVSKKFLFYQPYFSGPQGRVTNSCLSVTICRSGTSS
jgi:hypothetical protein